MDFDGETYDEQRDSPRLARQLALVREIMLDGHWRSLAYITGATGANTASVSARLRDLRKPKFGGYRVEKRHIAHGYWEYRLLPPIPRVVKSDPLLVNDPEAISMVPILGWKADGQVR